MLLPWLKSFSIHINVNTNHSQSILAHPRNSRSNLNSVTMKTFFALSFAVLAHQVAATGSVSPTTTGSNITVSSASAGSSTGAPRLNTWTALGCYSQDAAQPILERRMTGNDIFMSISACTSRCSDGKFAFAGLQNGNQCWCGNQLGGALAKNKDDCNVPCPGYTLETCGGVNALSVLKAEGIDSVVPSSTQTTTTAPPAITSSTSSKTSSVLSTLQTAGAMRNMAIFGW